VDAIEVTEKRGTASFFPQKNGRRAEKLTKPVDCRPAMESSNTEQTNPAAGTGAPRTGGRSVDYLNSNDSR
jgi:hypothetical protein